MRVRDLMTILPFSIRRDMPVFNAMRWMRQRRIRHLLVVEEGCLLGIVTDRDIRLGLPSPATSFSVWELTHLFALPTVGQVMTKNVIVVDAERDATEAARMMLTHRIGALPVMYGGQLVGIITETDIIRAFAAELAA